jgi:uncharacterized protein
MASGSLIDVHHHWLPAEHFDDVERWLYPGERVHRYDDGALEIHRGSICVFPRRTAILSREDDQLQAMDDLGVQSAVLSVGNWLEWLDLDGCRTVNDGLGRIARRYPDRFVGLAHVPALAPGALDELTRCIEELGFPGVMVICHFVREALPLDAPAVRPFWRKVEALNARVVIHPASLPLEYSAELPPERAILREHDLDKSVGRAHSVTVAVMRLLLGDLMDEFPRLQFVVPHLGGGFFAMGQRMLGTSLSHGAGDREANRAAVLRRAERLYFDTAPPQWPAASLRHAVEQLGAEHVLFGSDYPIQDSYLANAVRMFEDAGFDERTRRLVGWENTARLFGLPARV